MLIKFLGYACIAFSFISLWALWNLDDHNLKIEKVVPGATRTSHLFVTCLFMVIGLILYHIGAHYEPGTVHRQRSVRQIRSY